MDLMIWDIQLHMPRGRKVVISTLPGHTPLSVKIDGKKEVSLYEIENHRDHRKFTVTLEKFQLPEEMEYHYPTCAWMNVLRIEI